MSVDPTLSAQPLSAQPLSTGGLSTEAPSVKHPTDVVSLMFGALFVAAAAFWGLVDQDDLPGRGWYLPVLLIVVGLIGLIGSLGRLPQRSNHRRDPA